MDVILGFVAAVIVLAAIVLALFEFRIRQPDVLLLHESNGQIRIRRGTVYPRHFSLPLKQSTYPIQLTIDVAAAGNIGVRVKLVGSIAPYLDNIQALIRVGGWNSDAIVRAADETLVVLQGYVKEVTERSEIHTLSSSGILNYLTERADVVKQKYGVELVTLAVQSWDPTDPEIADALRQQEQARIMEQTERLNNQARVAAAKSKHQADEEIAEMEHALELKNADLKKEILVKESELAKQRLHDELAANRMRLAFEREELEVLMSNPELLILTPQAARLAEASQSLKNARTVVSLTPQELASSEMMTLFQNLLQRAVESKKDPASGRSELPAP